MPVRVLLADNSVVVLRAIVNVFTGRPEIEIVGQCSRLEQVKRLVAELKPDVLVIDLRIADHLNGETQQLKDSHSLRIVAISVVNDEQVTDLVKRVGADAFVDKIELFDKLIPAILGVSQP